MIQKISLQILSRLFCACIPIAILFFPAPVQAGLGPTSTFLRVSSPLVSIGIPDINYATLAPTSGIPFACSIQLAASNLLLGAASPFRLSTSHAVASIRKAEAGSLIVDRSNRAVTEVREPETGRIILQLLLLLIGFFSLLIPFFSSRRITSPGWYRFQIASLYGPVASDTIVRTSSTRKRTRIQ